MIDKVIKTIFEFKLIIKKDSILVALSGGPDSVALLYLLCRIKKRFNLNLEAVHINHQIRPQASKKEESFCRELCHELNIPLHIETINIPKLAKEQKKGIEETARDFRYETFERIASESGLNKICLGHHQGDQAETVLFRILRGTGITGLKGIPIQRGQIIRPLLNLSREEILSFLNENGIKYCIDQSNFNNDYKRNFIRNRLLKDIRKNLNPSVNSALVNLAETAVEEDKFLEKISAKMIRKSVSITAGGKIQLDLNSFNSYDLWLRRRVIRHCLTKVSNDNLMPDKTVVNRLVEFAINKGKEISVPGRIQVVVLKEFLIISNRDKLIYHEDFRPGKQVKLITPALNFKISANRSKSLPDFKKISKMTVYIDREKLDLPLIIRNIEIGDKCMFLGMKGRKKIGDYLTDKKIARVMRDEIPVVCDQKGIIWLVGQEISERVKITKSTKRIYRIGCTRRKEN